MKKVKQLDLYYIPTILWLIIIPLIVKVKFFKNPLIDVPWYFGETTLVDFFLYYKSMMLTVTGVLMLIMLCWQISKLQKKACLWNVNTRIFILIIAYIILAILSSLFSKYSYFCIHGIPDQFESIWNLIAYVIATIYCYYMIVYHDSEKSILTYIYIGAGLVGLICFLQFIKIDFYRFIYTGEEYSFTFEDGTVYGPFYNINYVGIYAILLLPLFVLILAYWKDIKLRIISVVMIVFLICAMIGAKSSTAWIAGISTCVLGIWFLLLKYSKEKKYLWISIVILPLLCISVFVPILPQIKAYIQACDIEMHNLESIYTHNDNVEINYKNEKMFVSMNMSDSEINFQIIDQNQSPIKCESSFTEDGYLCYNIIDDRFPEMILIPTVISENPLIYGFKISIDGKNWCFTNQASSDNTYYYFTDPGKLTKLTDKNVSLDFTPLIHLSAFANGRGYIWNKTLTFLKHYIFIGSGPDTFALVYPNDDYVDKYNNGYDNKFLTKPHNLYLQIAVQTGILSLICFLIFYIWYFISSLRIYYREQLDSMLSIMGFAIVLGTFGYMIAGLTNDSTITVAPMYWALMGTGIGINHRIKTHQ